MKPSKRFYLATLAAGFLFLGLMVATPAWAAGENPCSEDIAKFCGNVKGWQAIHGCLEQHERELSEACRAYEAKMGGPRLERREKVMEKVRFRRTCGSDIAKFCKDASPKQGGILKCLMAREAELSAPCSESIKALDQPIRK